MTDATIKEDNLPTKEELMDIIRAVQCKFPIYGILDDNAVGMCADMTLCDMKGEDYFEKLAEEYPELKEIFEKLKVE